ncbi:RAB6A-GEF complex partner protein 2 [Planococcus citri]|uniref:RAB6A-GEF complex partner protein 2 n=1 Tax=Planococcus citri TaxID=170843 RepID=UPI0031F8E640
MIEIGAKLIGGPVYLPGDSIGCCVTFTNRSPFIPGSRLPNDLRNIETLALSSAQIHCSCKTIGNMIKGRDAEGSNLVSHSINSDTSFYPCKEDSGLTVFKTEPKILFCDMKLNPGESRSFLYTETLPNEIPPSYRGKLVKYSYKITIGTQRINSAMKELTIPLRILVIDGFPEVNVCEDSIDLSPSNPFLDICEKDKELEPTLQVLQNITARRSTSFYNITNGKGKVATFCLFKSTYKLGEDIVGTFDFSSSTVRCVQFIVSLQCEEIISEKYRNANKYDKAVTTFNNCTEFCLNMKQCFLNLPIPLHVTPVFNTNLVSLKWKLHFEFVTCAKGIEEINPLDNVRLAPKCVNIETMKWNLPVQIYPTATISDLHSQTKSCLMI